MMKKKEIVAQLTFIGNTLKGILSSQIAVRHGSSSAFHDQGRKSREHPKTKKNTTFNFYTVKTLFD